MITADNEFKLSFENHLKNKLTNSREIVTTSLML
jgi:hypothetical protein